ncbi:MAG: toll/interleukin-1 receptor domain-containing protein [Prevotella sp.]|nr:toll/interleukin-1 receptor domain-containing protein [Prevotella sp.]
MKIFLSYGHDSNAPLIEKIKEYLSKDAEGNLKHEVWIDTSEIKAGKDWREKITKGVLESDVVIAGLSQHSTRIPGVCRDEISISIGVKGGNIKTILLEPSDVVAPPAMISHIQWLDMSDWKEHEKEGFDSEYFQEKFCQIAEMIETPENERFNGEINQLKETLEPISSISRIRALTEKEMYGRKWLYEKIEEWDKNSTQRLFWIVAGPGFGKSMFAANLQEQYNARIPAIQFVEWGKPDHSNPCRILKNLAFQLAVRYPEYRTFVLQQPDVINKKLNEKNEDELFDLLFCESTWLKIDGGQENVWVLIDALDEANDEYGNSIAQTLARHMDRMPLWMRFILTSRDDSKVRLPLQKYHPQVFDLEKYVKEKNSEDLLLYVRGELEMFNPTEEQVKQIVDKSQGVFLYLSLCVEGIRKGEYSLDHLNKLPDGLNGYYYEFFTRQFGNDVEKYKKEIAPVLQLMVAAKKNLQLTFINYLLGITDSKLYEVCASLEHICRITNENGDEVISFFHNSIENWLTNHRNAGLFYASKEDAHKIISSKYVEWLQCSDASMDCRWNSYGYGLFHLSESDSSWSLKPNKERLQNILCAMVNHSGVGGMTKYHNEARIVCSDFCMKLIATNKEQDVLNFFCDLYEITINGFFKTKIVSERTRCYNYLYERPIVPSSEIYFAPLNPSSDIYSATANTTAIGGLFRLLSENALFKNTNCKVVMHLILDTFAFYDYVLGEHVRFCSLTDICDFASRELLEISTALNEKGDEMFLEHVQKFVFSLTQRHPELYPRGGVYKFQEIGYISECKQKKSVSAQLYIHFLNEISIQEHDINDKIEMADTYSRLSAYYCSSGNNDRAAEEIRKAIELYELLCKLHNQNYHWDLSVLQNNLGSLYESAKDSMKAIACYEKAIKAAEHVQNKTDSMLAGLATCHLNLGICLDKNGDFDSAYHEFERVLEYRMSLAKKNPKDYLQPLGFILIRMSGLACRMRNEYDAELCKRKALYIYQQTDLMPVQYETAIQQLADNISSIKKSYKSFFGLFRINKDKLNKEFEEFANYFK